MAERQRAAPKRRSYHSAKPTVAVWLATAQGPADESKRDRERRISRSLLRSAVAAQLNQDGDPDQIEVIERPHTLPAVPAATIAGIRYSISHSRDWIAIAISDELDDLGVDIELGRPDRAFAKLATQFCSADEQDAIRAARTPKEQLDRFYRLWTAKEAVWKSLPEQLQAHPLRQLVVEAHRQIELAENNRANDNACRYVTTGWLGDYCLSVATDHPVSLSLIGQDEQPAPRDIQHETVSLPD